MTKETSNKIANLNFLMTMLIVFMHSGCLSYLGTIDNKVVYVIYDILRGFLNIAVPTFFALSTILFFRNYEPSKYKTKIKSRFKSLILPYLFWSTVFLIYYMILTNIPWIRNLDTTMEPIQYNVFYLLYAILSSKYAGALWYIRELFFLFLLAPIVYAMIVKLKKKNWIMIVLLVLLVGIFKPSNFTFLYWIPLYYIFAYLIINKIDFKINSKVLEIAFLIGGILLILFNDNIVFYGEYALRLYIPFFVFYLASKSKLLAKEPKPFMKNNFIIYCTHVEVVVAIKRMLMLLFGSNAVLCLIYQFVTCILVVVFLNLFIMIGKKIFPQFMAFISGGRI